MGNYQGPGLIDSPRYYRNWLRTESSRRVRQATALIVHLQFSYGVMSITAWAFVGSLCCAQRTGL